MLLSARFGSADVLLDVVRRVDLDKVINEAHSGTYGNPSKAVSFVHEALENGGPRITTTP